MALSVTVNEVFRHSLKVFFRKLRLKDFGGGLVFRVLAFYPNNPSLKSAKVYSFN